MIQAYNNIAVSLPVKKETKRTIKRRYESERVYDNVIDLNKCMPFYKISQTKESRDFSIGIKDAAFKLREKIKEMDNPDISGFDSKTVEVSNDKILSAHLIDQDTSGLPDNIEVRIKTLASAQVNKGKELLASSRGLPSGSYEFTVKSGNEIYKIIFYQENRKENYSVLKKMADLLNDTIPGINAVVENGTEKDYYRLSITAGAMDEDDAGCLVFEDSENNKISIVDYLGMNRMEKAQTLSEFELNGETRQTAGNSFKLDDKLYIKLKMQTDEPIYINIVPDSGRILKSVKSVLKSFNMFINLTKKHIEENSTSFSAKKLIAEVKELEHAYTEELSSCGIAASEDGTLHLNSDIAAIAARKGKIESFFCNDRGFMARLCEKAEEISANPVEYIDKIIVTYIDFKKVNYHYSYITSMYSGLFYNVIC